MRYMGIDYGAKRIGIAITDEAGLMAFPDSVISNDEKAIGLITEIVRIKNVGQIVIGESKNYQGEDNTIMKEARVFADRLSTETNIPVHFEPEFLTSAEAIHLQGENKKLDASAAAIILKSYLEKQT